MAKPPRQAVIYRDTGSVVGGAHRLTRTTGQKDASDLKNRRIDIQTGNFWVFNLPDLTKNNEAYIELTAVTEKANKDKIPHSFKQNVDVRDKNFSEIMQANEVLAGIEIRGTGMTLECRLTELDKINEEKFNAIKNYVDDNDIAGKSEALLKLTGTPFNPKDLVKTLFSSVKLIDTLNDDDRVWNEQPKFDLRPAAQVHLFEGWYAFVTQPTKKSGRKLPTRLLLSNGTLFTKYKSDTDNQPFNLETYLTFQVLAI